MSISKKEKATLAAGEFAVSYIDENKTYTGLEVHKLLCDAFIEGVKWDTENEGSKD